MSQPAIRPTVLTARARQSLALAQLDAATDDVTILHAQLWALATSLALTELLRATEERTRAFLLDDPRN